MAAIISIVHQELGRRPRQPAFPGKVVCESRCGSSEQRSGSSVGPPEGGFLLPESSIPTALLEAYGGTHSRVRYGRHDFTLQIGKYSQEVADLFQQTNSASAVFITADNPFSEVASDLDNVASNRVLLDRLKNLAVAVYEGAGQDAEGKWPAETSYLALGISRLQAATLGIEFRQNAVVWTDQDAIPELVLLR